jgi:cytochrome c oxidase assembly protein subunit 15
MNTTESSMARHLPIDPQRCGGPVAVLAIGWAISVAMWTVGYLTHLPLWQAPTPLTFAALVLCLLGGGWVAGRYTALGWRGVSGAALLSAVVNLMVLGSMLADRDAPLPPAWIWLSGYLIGSIVVVLVGWAIGRARQKVLRPIDWTFVLGIVAVVATGLLILAGGLVTGQDAGLAVPDWPNSFGSNMFTYPLSKMTGGPIYYEHAHRLFGTLVGLTTVVLAIHLWWIDRRRAIRWLGAAAIVAVIIQGIMGGFRVTLAHTGEAGVLVSGPADETTASVILRVAHGVFGQVFLGLLVVIAVMSTRTWRHAGVDVRETESAKFDQRLGVLLIVGLVLQLTLGAILRHTEQMLLTHISVAALVLPLGVTSGVRAWGLYGELPLLRTTGLWLVGLMLVQLMLGLAALAVLSDAVPRSVNAIITTAHQGIGAALLAVAVALAMWSYRLLARSQDAVVRRPSDAPRQSTSPISTASAPG